MNRTALVLCPLLFLATAGVPVDAQSTLEAPVGDFLDYPLDLATPGHGAQRIEESVRVSGAAWLRLYFEDVLLSPGSAVRMTSLLDGETQTLDAAGLAMWSDSSAYFNGDEVRIELLTGPDADNDRLSVAQVAYQSATGLIHPRGNSGECGICGTDDRAASTQDWVGRLMPIGCTAEVFNRDGCALSAGHCIGGNQLIQFRVPASNANCSLNNPPVADQFPVLQNQFRNNGVGDDWAVLRMGVNSLGQTSVQRYGRWTPISTVLGIVGAPCELFGYGLDLTCVVSQTQRRSAGSITFRGGSWYEFNADVRGGNSGSGFLAGGRIIGVVTHCSFGCPNFATRVDVPAFANARNAICPTCDADLNGDDVIDLTYLSLAIANFGCAAPPCAGDVDGDGDTDLEDLALVLAVFGESCN